jgi:tRNA pseudouridine38-40 synthase
VPTYKLTLEYDGTAYAGWQRQAKDLTVQGMMEAALKRITQTPITVIGAGRTDAGVHALGQVAHFKSEKLLTPDEWARALNAVLPGDIAVLSAELVADDFHARYGATGKVYEYRILNRPVRAPLDRHRVWHVKSPLNVPAMREAVRLLLGRHDFASFQGHPTDTKNTVCELRRLEIMQDGDRIRFEADADRFLKQMMRAIVGTLVEVGRGKRAPASMKDILAAKDRRAAGMTAPPHGLYLLRVDY